MTLTERRLYRIAARHAAQGWSANKSIKSFAQPRGSMGWEAARKGFADMRTHLEMQEILEEVRGRK